jgi:hypothetical protein
VIEKLHLGWSPQQIAGRSKLEAVESVRHEYVVRPSLRSDRLIVVDRVSRATMLRKVETKQTELGAVTLSVDNGKELHAQKEVDSSAAWLDPQDWDERARPPPEVIAGLRARYDDIEGLGSARTPPQTWLAQCGWRVRGRGGALKLHELPRFR